MTNHFPRAHRHTITKRILDAALDLKERLDEANVRRGRARLERLERADEALAHLRSHLRLAERWGWLSRGQHEHCGQMLAEVGKLLGGWMGATRGQPNSTLATSGAERAPVAGASLHRPGASGRGVQQ
jgi:hypothetical protein